MAGLPSLPPPVGLDGLVALLSLEDSFPDLEPTIIARVLQENQGDAESATMCLSLIAEAPSAPRDAVGERHGHGRRGDRAGAPPLGLLAEQAASADTLVTVAPPPDAASTPRMSAAPSATSPLPAPDDRTTSEGCVRSRQWWPASWPPLPYPLAVVLLLGPDALHLLRSGDLPRYADRSAASRVVLVRHPTASTLRGLPWGATYTLELLGSAAALDARLQVRAGRARTGC